MLRWKNIVINTWNIGYISVLFVRKRTHQDIPFDSYENIKKSVSMLNFIMVIRRNARPISASRKGHNIFTLKGSPDDFYKLTLGGT